MKTKSEEIREELERLIATRFTLPPKQFSPEELAVRQTLENSFNEKQLDLMKQLIRIINDSEQAGMSMDKQNEFLKNAYLTLTQLYNTHLNKAQSKPYQKEKFDRSKAMLQDYAAIVANLKDSTEIMVTRLSDLHNHLKWSNISTFAKDILQSITPIMHSIKEKSPLDLTHVEKIYQSVEKKIQQKQDEIIVSSDLKLLLHLNNEALLSESEKLNLGVFIEQIYNALYFSIFDENAGEQLKELLNLEHYLASAIKHINYLTRSKREEFESFPKINSKSNQLYFNGSMYVITLKQNEMKQLVEWLKTDKYKSIGKHLNLSEEGIDDKEFLKQFNLLVSESVNSYIDSYEKIKDGLYGYKNAIAWDIEISNLKKNSSLIEGIICINESMILAPNLEANIKYLKHVIDKTHSLKLITQEKISEVLYTDPSKELLLEKLESINEVERKLLWAYKVSYQSKIKVSLSTLQLTEKLPTDNVVPLTNLTSPIIDIDDLSEIEWYLTNLPKCDEFVNQLKDSIVEKSFYELTFDLPQLPVI